MNGPNFLRGNEKNWPARPDGINILPDEALEWRKNVEIYETQAQQVKPLDVFIQHYSSWYRLQKGVAWLIRFTNHLRVLCRDRSPKDQASHSSNSFGRDKVTGARVKSLSVEELRSARTSLIRYVQRECFPDEVARLKRKTASISYSNAVVKKSSSLAALSPFMGDDGLLRVSGRLDRAELSFDAKLPAIIPSKHHIVDLLIRHYHEREGHSGARAVLAAIQQELWILRGRSRIRWIIDKCVICRKKYAPPCEQLMVSLPVPRVTAFERPFASTGVDYFGPLMVKRGRCQVKRYMAVYLRA